MIYVKGTVRPYSLAIMAACANVGQQLHLDVTITSGNDSRHMQDSKHYADEALDVRTKTMPTLELKQTFVNMVLGRLGHGYQGFLEDVGGPNEHAHFERDVSEARQV